ncbi:hypothetical protein NKH77_09470 [Streptomyces sp. M19]
MSTGLLVVAGMCLLALGGCAALRYRQGDAHGQDVYGQDAYSQDAYGQDKRVQGDTGSGAEDSAEHSEFGPPGGGTASAPQESPVARGH